MMSVGKEENVIQNVLQALECGQLLLSFHAMEQMNAREVKFSDISEAIYRCSREEHKDVYHQNPSNMKWSWRYALRGRNDSGEKDLRVIVTLENPKTVIITVIDLERRE
jgi:hypothetical protein